jgi:hypothetical protein
MKRILPKKWHLLRAILNVAGFLFVFVGTRQTSFAIYAAIATKGSVTFEADGSLVDSFNSADPSKSTGGQYDPALAGDDGLIISTGVFSLTNGDVYGSVLTGPGGTVNLGLGSGIGTHSWLSTNSGIEPGYVPNGAAFDFPTVTLYTNGNPPPPGAVVSTTGTSSAVYVTNSPTPPPAPGGFQTIADIVENVYIAATNTDVQVAGSNTVVTTITNCTVETTTNCGSTAVNYGKIPPAPGAYCPATPPWQQSGMWFDYPITGYTYTTNYNYTYATNYVPAYSTNYVPVFGTNYNYTIYTAILQTNYYDHLLSGGNYCAGDLAGTTLVTGYGRSALTLTNGLNLTALDSVTISPRASLVLYVGGGNVTITGNGLVNDSGLDQNLQIYCAASVASLSLNQSAPFSGVVIAPDTDVNISGDGSANAIEYSGGIMAKSLIAEATVHMHGDEAVNFPIAPSLVSSISPSPPGPITNGPQNLTVLVGSQVTFQVWPAYPVLGPTPSIEDYLWYFSTNQIASTADVVANWTNRIANTLTNSSLTLSNVTTDMAGTYVVEVPSPVGNLASQPIRLSVLATPAATLDAFSISTANQFQLNVDGLSGYFYSVEGSSNLSDWTPLLTNICPFTFTDTNQLGLQYFYRAVYVPQ